MGSEHLANAASLSLFGPDGFRGAVTARHDDSEIVIGESDATPGLPRRARSRPGRGSSSSTRA